MRNARPAAWLAADGVKNAEPKVIGRVVARAEDAVAFRRPALHALAAARPGPHQHQAANELGGREGDFLRHKAADRKAEHVDFRQSERLDESDGVGAHLGERRRHLAGTGGDAGIVEQNHLPAFGETIGHRRVPMVHGPGIVLVEDERQAVRLAETAIGEADTVGLGGLRRRGLVGVLGH